jgi:hypothetical protein
MFSGYVDEGTSNEEVQRTARAATRSKGLPEYNQTLDAQTARSMGAQVKGIVGKYMP